MYPSSPRSSQVNSLFSDREVTSVQLPSASYHKSQHECLEQLHKYRSSLAQEEQNIGLSMQNYYMNLKELAYLEHQKVREDVLRMMDDSFEKNWQFLNEAIIFQGEPNTFATVRRRIQMVSQRLAELEMGLRTENYRPYIAEVVTSNFDAVIEEINAVVMNTQQALNNSVPSVSVDSQKLEILRETVSSVLRFNGPPPVSSVLLPPGIEESIASTIMSGGSRSRSPNQGAVHTKHTKKVETETIKFL